MDQTLRLPVTLSIAPAPNASGAAQASPISGSSSRFARAKVPASKDAYQQALRREVERLLRVELIEKGELSPGHPAVKELHRLAQRLRDAALSDPMLKELGVKLPKSPIVHVLPSSEENGFVNPLNPAHLYYTAGLLALLKNLNQRAALTSHEQAHLIFESLRENSGSSRAAARFGEFIWKDPLEDLLSRPSAFIAARTLFSQKEEMWCDTFGALPYLDAAGIDPRAMISLHFAFLENAGVLEKRRENATLGASLGQAVRSHPPSEHRLWGTRAVNDAMSYPSAFQAQEPKLAQEVSRSSLPNFAWKIVELLSQETLILETFYLSEVILSSGAVLFPQARFGTQFFSPNFLPKLKGMEPAERFSVLWALTALFSSRTRGEVSAEGELFEGAPLSPGRRQECLKLGKSLFQRLHEAEKRDERSSPEMVKLMFEEARMQFEALLSKLNLLNVEREMLARPMEQPAGTLTSSDLLDIAKRLPELCYSHTDFFDALCEFYSHREFLVLEPKVDENDAPRGVKALRLVPTDFSVVPAQGGGSTNRELADYLESLIESSVAEALGKGEFPSFKEFISWLKDFREQETGRLLAFGPVASEARVFDLFLSAAARPIWQAGTLSQRVDAGLRAGFGCGRSYAELKIHGYLVKHAGLSSLAKAASSKVQRLALARLFRKHNPNLADCLLVESLEPSSEDFVGIETRAGKREISLPQLKPSAYGERIKIILGRLSEPDIVYAPQDKHQAVLGSLPIRLNLHDCWALGGKILNDPKPADLRGEFRRGAASMSAFLSRLKNLPHLFSPSLWRLIAENCVRSLSDLEKLTRFIQEAYSQERLDELPWRDRNRVQSLIAVMAQGLAKLGSMGALGKLPDKAASRLIELCRLIPRTAKRNEVILNLLSCLSSQPEVSRESVLRCARLIETEPFEEMIKSHIDELSKSHEPRCKELEAWLDKAGVWPVPVAAVERGETMSESEARDILDEAGRLALDIEEDKAPWPEEHVAIVEHTGYLQKDLIWPPINLLPKLFSPAGLRDLAARLLAEEKPILPVLETKARALRQAEAAGPIILKSLGAVDPLRQDPFSKGEVSACAFWSHFDAVLASAQPVPTALRDSWILHAMRSFTQHGGKFGAEDFSRLRSQLYLPDSIEELGLYEWEALKEELKLGVTAQSPAELINRVEAGFPYYSLTRNRVLQELRAELGSYDELIARKLSLLEWTPGLPPPVPSCAAITSGALFDFQVSLLRTFEDYDAVEFVLFSYGVIPDKPWSMRYVEYALGGTLDELNSANQTLDPTARRALLHRLFGGANGIFARSDQAALSLLSDKVGAYIAEALRADPHHSKLIKKLCHLVFHEAGFSVHTRTEVLSTLADWIKEQKEGYTSTGREGQARLILNLFHAAGPGGDRLLQGLLIEPGLFPEGLKRFLRQVQFDTEPGNPLLPFHRAKAQGLLGLELGPRRGGGSMAEVYEVKGTDQARLERTLIKALRGDTLGQLEGIRAPMKEVAKSISAFGYPWSEKIIDFVADSCRAEAKELHLEARRTGREMAEAFALGGEIHELPYAIVVAGSAHRPAIIVPRRIQAGGRERAGDGVMYCFFQGDLGEDFKSLAALEHQFGKEGLAEAIRQRGLELSQIAAAACEIFLVNFLKSDRLLKDFGFGNTGTTKLPDGQAAIGFIDFGSIHEDFPRRWKNWIVRFIMAAYSGQEETLRALLLEAAAASSQGLGPEDRTSKLLQGKLDEIMQSLRAVQSQRTQSFLGGADKFIGLVYEHWPMPEELRDSCEALRKVAREWGPYLPGSALRDLGQKLYPYLIQPSLPVSPAGPPSVPQSTESVSDSAERLERLSRLVLQLEKEPENQHYLLSLTELPPGTILRWKEGTEWKKITSIQAQPIGCRVFRGAGGEIDLQNVPGGFFEIEVGDLSYYLSVPHCS